MKWLIGLFTSIPFLLFSQTDYDQLSNWYYHPDKVFNFIENFDLDVAVIDKNLELESVIEIDNNSGIDTGIDIFWVHPTHLIAPPIIPTSIPIANQDQTYIGLTILAQGALLAKYGRFYAPKYRQASPASFLGFGSTEEARAAALMETYSDIKASFMNYLENHNNGNRIILAGHSQGSFLLAMLLRDVFDNDIELKDKLVTASLAGMGYVYSSPDVFDKGWWESIGLCQSQEECGCVHYWRSYEEAEPLPEPNLNLPSFSQTLVDNGLVFRKTDLDTDIFRQDSLFYTEAPGPLRYYIAPDASYELASGFNYIAFDSLYSIRLKRESFSKVGFALERIADENDLRPNDIDSTQNTFFSEGDLHTKDYHIYIWALLKQIDSKLDLCGTVNNLTEEQEFKNELAIYPNPSSGLITINYKGNASDYTAVEYRVVNSFGHIIKSFHLDSNEKAIHLSTKGMYYIVSKFGATKVVIH